MIYRMPNRYPSAFSLIQAHLPTYNAILCIGFYLGRLLNLRWELKLVGELCTT
ncbi:hypothetical protein BDZ91DRAFT_751433 [Kalaharituber pfeilii]|nr:hypothetical protein BDZ91DRAFT_751433 [Kalaharituber pfeilii]